MEKEELKSAGQKPEGSPEIAEETQNETAEATDQPQAEMEGEAIDNLEPIETNEKGELLTQMDRVALHDGEKIRIVISENEDGSLVIHTKIADGVDGKPTEIVGLMEVAKYDVLSRQLQRSAGPAQQQAPQQQLTPEQLEEVDLVLEDCDFKVFPELKSLGKAAGDTVSLPRITVDALLKEREDCGCGDEEATMKVVE